MIKIFGRSTGWYILDTGGPIYVLWDSIGEVIAPRGGCTDSFCTKVINIILILQNLFDRILAQSLRFDMCHARLLTSKRIYPSLLQYFKQDIIVSNIFGQMNWRSLCIKPSYSSSFSSLLSSWFLSSHKKLCNLVRRRECSIGAIITQIPV